MKNFNQQVADINWQGIAEDMNEKRYAVIEGLISDEDCESLIAISNKEYFGKTITMERYPFDASN